MRLNEASWGLSTGSAAKAREFDGIGDGIKKYEPTESGVNTEDGECY